MSMQDTDGLVIRARHDGGALGQLYERYYDRVFCYCMRRLFIREIAEDTTATVFLRVAKYIPGFRGTTEHDFRNWLFAIATSEINNYFRIARRRDRILDAVREEQAAMAKVAADGGGEFHRLDWPVLYEALLQLRPRQQSAIVLRFWEGLEHRAIAEVLGCRPVTVRVMLMRAIRRLRKHLGVIAT